MTLAEGGENQHGRVLVFGDFACRRDAVETWHLDVEDRQVWLMLADQRRHLVATARFANDLVALFLEHFLEIEADYRFVFCDDDTGRHGNLLRAGDNEFTGRSTCT